MGLVDKVLRVGREWQANYNFSIELEGVLVAQFKSCSGLGLDIDQIEYRAGTDRWTRKRPGKVKYKNIILKRGVMLWGHDSMWKWVQTVVEGKTERKSGSIVLRDDRMLEWGRFNFFEAWPCRWKGWDLDGHGKGTVIEEIELACERVERFPIPGPGAIL